MAHAGHCDVAWRVTSAETTGTKAGAIPRGEFSVSRTLAVAFPLMVLGAVWVEVTEVYRPAGDLSGGVPPAAAFGLFLPALLFCAAIPALRWRWEIPRAELVAVFSVLFLTV